MSGRLVRREQLSFDGGDVIAHSPRVDASFEGSVELEAFAGRSIPGLDGREGTAALDFVVNGAFTPMLAGNETAGGREFQATHSNLNYADHRTEDLSDASGMRT